jgi:hypothetical protein
MPSSSSPSKRPVQAAKTRIEARRTAIPAQPIKRFVIFSLLKMIFRPYVPKAEHYKNTEYTTQFKLFSEKIPEERTKNVITYV